MISLSGKHDGHIFHVIYLVGFFFALHMALPEYISSSFIEERAGEQWVGIFYTLASLVSIFAIIAAPYVLSRFGNYKIIVATSVVQTFVLIGLSTNPGLILSGLFFITFFVGSVLMYFSLDIILEHNTENTKTGRLRGGYFTILNLGWVVSPFIVSLVMTNNDYWKIYAISAALTTLVAGLSLVHFRGFKDPAYARVPFWNTLSVVYKRKHVRGIFLSNILLHFFYAWMVIYMPIYLHEHIGFPWNEIGIMFGIMLLPFVLFELPAGRLADERYGEKGILAIGFLIMAVATAVLPFINGTEFILWTVTLFVTRIGASLVEIMNETYFFKHIESADTNILSLYKTTRPFSYLLAPALGVITLLLVPYKFIFLVLAAVVALGALVALRLTHAH
ncbi:MAG: MFS transporter [Patescibacteria group bacterium]